MAKRRLIREVVIFLSGVALGVAVALGAKGRGPILSARELQVPAALPRVEVNIEGGKSLGHFAYADSASSQADAWLEYLTDPRRTLLKWREGGNYPVFDIPPGWAVVWLDASGEVLGSSVGNGARTNMAVPSKPVAQALILPTGDAPAAGTKVQVYERALKP